MAPLRGVVVGDAAEDVEAGDAAGAQAVILASNTPRPKQQQPKLRNHHL